MIACCRFGNSDRTFDFDCGDMDLTPGQKVWVNTQRGRAKVTVVEVRETSEFPGELASVIGLADDDSS